MSETQSPVSQAPTPPEATAPAPGLITSPREQGQITRTESGILIAGKNMSNARLEATAAANPYSPEAQQQKDAQDSATIDQQGQILKNQGIDVSLVKDPKAAIDTAVALEQKINGGTIEEAQERFVKFMQKLDEAGAVDFAVNKISQLSKDSDFGTFLQLILSGNAYDRYATGMNPVERDSAFAVTKEDFVRQLKSDSKELGKALMQKEVMNALKEMKVEVSQSQLDDIRTGKASLDSIQTVLKEIVKKLYNGSSTLDREKWALFAPAFGLALFPTRTVAVLNEDVAVMFKDLSEKPDQLKDFFGQDEDEEQQPQGNVVQGNFATPASQPAAQAA